MARHIPPVRDVHDLRVGRWYDEDPIKSTSTHTGGTGVSGNIEQVRAAILAAVEKANEALGATQEAHSKMEEAQGMLYGATEGSGQADVTTALGLAAQTVNDLEQSRAQITAMISESEGIANRL